jgi:hypothetical protein
MFLHDEGVVPSQNIVQMQNAKMQKDKTLLYPIEIQYDIIISPLQNLCISLQKGRKGCF